MKIAGFEVVVNPECPPDYVYFINGRIEIPSAAVVGDPLVVRKIEEMVENRQILACHVGGIKVP